MKPFDRILVKKEGSEKMPLSRDLPQPQKQQHRELESPMAKPNRLRTVFLHFLIMAVVFPVGILFLGIAILFLVHLFIISRAFRAPPDRQDRQSSSSSGGLSRFDLQRLPCFDFTSGCAVDCAVCLEALRSGDRCRALLPCKHSFHARCVDAWLATVPACPICRSTVRPSH